MLFYFCGCCYVVCLHEQTKDEPLSKFEVSTLHGESFQQPENFKIAVGSKIRIFYNLDKLFHRYDKLLKLAANRSSSILFLTHSAVPSCLLLPPAQPSFNTQPKIDAPATPFSCGGSINADVTRDDAVSCAARPRELFFRASERIFFVLLQHQPAHHQQAEQQGTAWSSGYMYSHPFDKPEARLGTPSLQQQQQHSY